MSAPAPFASLFDPSILRSALLPAFQQHVALTIPFYALGRATDRFEVKDILWGLSPVLVGWYSTLNRYNVNLLSTSSWNPRSIVNAWNILGRTDRLLLAGITAWGLRLTYRVASRAYRRGQDDSRYDALHEPGEGKTASTSWNWAPLTMFIPEAAAQTLLTLPFTLLNNVPRAKVLSIPDKYAGVIESVAIGLWGASFALEVLADWQLARHQRQVKEGETFGLVRDGAWSIVRHPNYLADFLLSLSYPTLLLSQSLLSPFHLLSPLTNYIFLRFIGGDAQTEQHQEQTYMEKDPSKMLDLVEMREAENSFWPDWRVVVNKWAWGVVAVGAGTVYGVRAMRGMRIL